VNQQIRSALERSLNRPVTDAIWDKLVDGGYVKGVGDGEPRAFEELKAEARSLERLVREHIRGRQARSSRERLPAPPGFHTLEAEDARAEASRRVISRRIGRRPDVQRLRHQMTTGLVPELLLEREWEGVIQLIMADFGLSEQEALNYLSDGADGAPPPIEVRFEQNVGEVATSARMRISFEPWVSERSILQAIRMAQDFVLGHGRDHRLMSAKVAKVVEWVERCRATAPRRTFRSMAAEWNDLCERGQIPKDWYYPNRDMLSRDYHRGEKALLRPRYFDVYPDDQTGPRYTKLRPVSWSRGSPSGSRKSRQV
jgi:hypothetical protein